MSISLAEQHALVTNQAFRERLALALTTWAAGVYESGGYSDFDQWSAHAALAARIFTDLERETIRLARVAVALAAAELTTGHVNNPASLPDSAILGFLTANQDVLARYNPAAPAP